MSRIDRTAFLSRRPRWLVSGAILAGTALVSMYPTAAFAWGGAGDTTQVISAGANGLANGESTAVGLSSTGRYAAFTSDATNLVSADTNRGHVDLFVRDRKTGRTTLESLDPTNHQFGSDIWTPVISATGRYVAFTTDSGVYLRDLGAGVTKQIYADNLGLESNPSIAAAGQQVAFERSGFIGQDTYISQIWLWNARTGKATKVLNRVEHPLLSADGTKLAYQTSTSFVTESQVYVRTLATGKTALVSKGKQGAGDLSSDVKSLSADGRYVGFTSYARNLVPSKDSNLTDVYVRDMTKPAPVRASSVSGTVQAGDSSSQGGYVSADGHYVAFQSEANNLVANDTNMGVDAFVFSTVTGTVYRVSLTSNGAEISGNTYGPTISGDGHHVLFETGAPNVTPGDTDVYGDVFIRNVGS